MAAPAVGKFKEVVVNMSLLGNALYALLIITVIMIVSVVIIIVQSVRGKKVEPSK